MGGRCWWLRAGDLPHGVVEGQAEHLDKEVDGVAGQVAWGPAPVAVFDEEAGISGHLKVIGCSLDQLEAAFLEQRQQRGDPGGADLLVRPAGSSRTRPVARDQNRTPA